MAVERISQGKYSDGVNTVNAKTKAEAVKKLAAMSKPKPKPKPKPPTKPTPVDVVVAAPVSVGGVVWVDVLGGAAYADACVQAVKYLARKSVKLGLGFFWVEFDVKNETGKNLFLRAYAAGCRHFRIQALWRSSHVYGANEQIEALKYAKELQALKIQFPDAEIWFSPFCEHNVSSSQMLPFFNKLIAVAPSLVMVNSVWKADRVKDSRIVHEVHTVDKPCQSGDFVSGDGCLGDPKSPNQGMVDINMVDYLKLYQNAGARLGWILRFNLNEAKQDKIAPKNRTAKATLGDILAMAWILVPLPPQPVVAGAKTWPVGNKSFVWKCYSEDVYNANKGQPEDNRERKPVCIFPKGGLGETITVTDVNGKRICTSTPGKSFSGGGFRYYFSMFGWEMAEAAFASSGSEWVLVVVGKEKFLIHPAFRWGYWR